MVRAPDDFARVLGRVLRQTRKRRGLSQEALGADAGVATAMISQIERGVSSPSVLTLRRVAGALGLSASTLLALAEDEDVD